MVLPPEENWQPSADRTEHHSPIYLLHQDMHINTDKNIDLTRVKSENLKQIKCNYA